MLLCEGHFEPNNCIHDDLFFDSEEEEFKKIKVAKNTGKQKEKNKERKFKSTNCTPVIKTNNVKRASASNANDVNGFSSNVGKQLTRQE